MNGCYTSQLESNYHEKQHVVNRVEQESEFLVLMKTICLTRHIESFEKICAIIRQLLIGLTGTSVNRTGCSSGVI